MAEVQYACDVRNKFGDCKEIDDPFEMLRQMEEATKHKDGKTKATKTAKPGLTIKDTKPLDQTGGKQTTPAKKTEQQHASQSKNEQSSKKAVRITELPKTQQDQGFAEIQRRGRRGPRFADENVGQRFPRRGRGALHDTTSDKSDRLSPDKKMDIGQVSLTFKRGGGGRARRSFGDGRPYQRSSFAEKTGDNAEERNDRNDVDNAEPNESQVRYQQRRRFDNRGRGEFRGRRLFDRHSGNNRVGVKSEEKRQGAGSHNWGKEVEIMDDSGEVDQSLISAEGVEADENKEAKERTPSPVMMSLDEWKELQKAKTVEQTIERRKPGEGDPTKWEEPYIKYHKKPEDLAKYEKLQRKSPVDVEDEDVEEEEEVDKTSELQKSISRYLFNDPRRVRGSGRNRQTNRRYEKKAAAPEPQNPIPQPSDFPALR